MQSDYSAVHFSIPPQTTSNSVFSKIDWAEFKFARRLVRGQPQGSFVTDRIRESDFYWDRVSLWSCLRNENSLLSSLAYVCTCVQARISFDANPHGPNLKYDAEAGCGEYIGFARREGYRKGFTAFTVRQCRVWMFLAEVNRLSRELWTIRGALCTRQTFQTYLILQRATYLRLSNRLCSQVERRR